MRHCYSIRRFLRAGALTAVLMTVTLGTESGRAQDSQAASSPTAQVAKAVGTIKSIRSDSITVATESGTEVEVKLIGSTKIVRVSPGEKDLKLATALRPQDLQIGDRVLVRGQSSANQNLMTALAVIVMKQADVASVRQHELDEWKSGVGGLVTNVDVASGTIAISSGGLTKRTITVHIAKTTVLRRYAPGSVKFDDAKPAPIDQIKPGDQLLARGTRNSEGSELSAEEVVSGTFRSIAGPIKAVDSANNTMTVQDVIAKVPTIVKVSSDSQIWKLPPEVAQRFAMRLKHGAGGAGNQGSGNQNNPSDHSQSADGVHHNAVPANGSQVPADSQAARPSGANGPADLQRILSRLPAIKLTDLQKGDVVYVLATGASSDTVIASKIVAGVEPILTAAPNGSASSLLSPWSFGAGAAEGEASQ